MIEKITKSIEKSDGLIERANISCLKRKHTVLTSSTDRKKFKNLPAHKIKKHPFARRFGVKAEVIRQFLYAKVSLPNDPPEPAENNVIIDGYVDDLTSENYKASLTGELHNKCEFFCKKDYIYIYIYTYIYMCYSKKSFLDLIFFINS